jgi:methanogenic corrinoid protein MtbC1
MFRWCSYCQSFIGEAEPREDFSLSHGVCTNCRDRLVKKEFIDYESIEPIKAFFNKIQSLSFSGQTINKSEILHEAKSLKIKPSDLLAGILQPLLYEIGRLYTLNQMTIVYEHKFSAFIHDLIGEIRSGFLDSTHYPTDGRVDVILSCANGNIHAFGVTFLELCLREAGISVEAIYPGVPSEQLVDYVTFMKPKVLGLSVSMLEQMEDVKNIAYLLNKDPAHAPYFLVGGFAIQKEVHPLQGINFMHGTIKDVVALIEEKIRTHRLTA